MSALRTETWQRCINRQGIDPIVTLEKQCWAPWLAASKESMQKRSETFPEGQLCITEGEFVLATLSVNRFNWNGEPDSLPTWDGVAGDGMDFSGTFVLGGNTLCLMSMNVRPDARGRQLPTKLLEALFGIDEESHIISSFRPSAYNKFTQDAVQKRNSVPSFEEYCQHVRIDGRLTDPWLRSLAQNGMQQLVVAPEAMRRDITAAQFAEYRQPDWFELQLPNGKGVAWWCNQTGFLYPDGNGDFTYIEGNVWGSLRQARSTSAESNVHGKLCTA